MGRRESPRPRPGLVHRQHTSPGAGRVSSGGCRGHRSYWTALSAWPVGPAPGHRVRIESIELVVLIIGLVLLALGAMGRAVGDRKHYY